MCKYLKPQFTLMLDVGTRPDTYSVLKLFNFMKNNPQAGGICGELEIDMERCSGYSSFFVQAF